MTTLERAIELRKEGRIQESLPLLEQALREDPLNPQVWKHAGFTAIAMRQFKFAKSMLESYARSAPEDAFGHFNLGYARWALGDYEAAQVATVRALAIHPNFVKANIAAGYLAYMIGQPDQGRAYHDHALSLGSTNADDLTLLGILRVLRGDYAGGWPMFDAARWRGTEWKTPKWRREAKGLLWNGEDISDRTLYLHGEGGFGDTLMFCRYGAMLADRAREVVLVADPPLDRLMRQVRGIIRVEKESDLEDPNVAHVSSWSLPAILGTTLETIPNECPYFHPPEDGPQLEPTDRLRVGLAWAGNPELPHDPDRSCPQVELLAPLCEVPGIDWYSMQIGVRTEDARRLTIRPSPAVKDFAETAYLLRQLDLVVTVDTSLAHLAGGLGVPTWVMVPTYREFRWEIDGDRAPWYPTMRLFRRPHTAHWPVVIRQIATGLGDLVRRRAERPDRRITLADTFDADIGA